MSDLKNGPIEIILSQSNLEVSCLVSYEDESTTHLDIDSLSIRGAQREITGYLVGRGYKPEGRWEILMENGRASEHARKFRAPSGK